MTPFDEMMSAMLIEQRKKTDKAFQDALTQEELYFDYEIDGERNDLQFTCRDKVIEWAEHRIHMRCMYEMDMNEGDTVTEEGYVIGYRFNDKEEKIEVLRDKLILTMTAEGDE